MNFKWLKRKGKDIKYLGNWSEKVRVDVANIPSGILKKAGWKNMYFTLPAAGLYPTSWTSTTGWADWYGAQTNPPPATRPRDGHAGTPPRAYTFSGFKSKTKQEAW